MLCLKCFQFQQFSTKRQLFEIIGERHRNNLDTEIVRINSVNGCVRSLTKVAWFKVLFIINRLCFCFDQRNDRRTQAEPGPVKKKKSCQFMLEFKRLQ